MVVSRSAVEPKLLEDLVQVVGGRLSYLNRVCQSFIVSQSPQDSGRWQGQKIWSKWLITCSKSRRNGYWVKLACLTKFSSKIANFFNRSYCWLWWRRHGWSPCFAFLRVILANSRQQKWSSCSWLLLLEFVKQYRKYEEEREDAIKAGILDPKTLPDLPLPTVSYVCPSCPPQPCSIMTAENRDKPDKSWLELTLSKVRCILLNWLYHQNCFTCLTELDRLNIIAIDVSRLECYPMPHWPRSSDQSWRSTGLDVDSACCPSRLYWRRVWRAACRSER